MNKPIINSKERYTIPYSSKDDLKQELKNSGGIPLNRREFKVEDVSLDNKEIKVVVKVQRDLGKAYKRYLFSATIKWVDFEDFGCYCAVIK